MSKLFWFLSIALVTSSFETIKSDDCITKSSADCIPQIPKGFNYIKNFGLTWSEKEYIEYSYVFTSKTNYFLKVCKEQGDNVKLDLMNSSRGIVASNSINGERTDAISLSCSATGIYYLRIWKEKGQTPCGICLLAFGR